MRAWLRWNSTFRKEPRLWGGGARHTLSRVIHGQSGISPEMAIRLEKADWSNADHWLRLQAAYDLAQARKRQDSILVRRYSPGEVRA